MEKKPYNYWKIRLCYLFLTLMIMIVPVAAFGDTVTLRATDDAMVSSKFPDNHFTQYLSVYRNGCEYLTYLKFDLISLPSNAVITKAELSLYAYDFNGHTSPVVDLYYVAGDTWTESGLTYNSKPVSGALLDTSPALSATGTWQTFDLLSAWDYSMDLESTDSKLSLLLKAGDQSANPLKPNDIGWQVRYVQDEGTNGLSYFPHLCIEYTVPSQEMGPLGDGPYQAPEPASILLLGLGLVGLATLKRKV
jgi:hypothetical protein